MNKPAWEHETLALWLAPFFSTAPLVPLFGLWSSPLFLGRLMDDPTHPMNWPVLGPWLSSMAVVFDGTILAYFVMLTIALPVYLFYRRHRAVSATVVFLLFSVAGISASQLVRMLQAFRQPDLKAFAISWMSPLVGCLCGLAAGAFFILIARGYFSRRTLKLISPLPLATLLACAVALMNAANLWRNNQG